MSAEGPIPTREAKAASPFSTAGLVALAIVFAVVLWLAGRLLLYVFAGILFAIFLTAGATLVSRVTRLSAGWSLLVTVMLLLGTLTLAGWLFVPRLVEQVQELTDAVPQAVSQLADRLRETPWGSWLLDQVEGRNPAEQEDKTVVEHATVAAVGLFDAIVAFVVILFVGLYLAVAPLSYVRGVLRLVPLGRRRRAGEVLFAAGYQLRWWLGGQLLSMLVVGVTMGVGLTLIDVPLAFALGVLAGLLEFIPTLGPPLAVIPAALLALVEEPQKALYVLILYSIVQTGEAYLLTPLVQQRVVHLQPVVTITAQIFFAWTVGIIGLLVAVPLVAALQIAVQMWYVEDVLGDKIALTAEREGRRELLESGVLD